MCISNTISFLDPKKTCKFYQGYHQKMNSWILPEFGLVTFPVLSSVPSLLDRLIPMHPPILNTSTFAAFQKYFLAFHMLLPFSTHHSIN